MTVNAVGFQAATGTSIQLPASQQELLAKVFALHKPTVVLLTTAAPSVSTRIRPTRAAVLDYGQRGGGRRGGRDSGPVQSGGALADHVLPERPRPAAPSKAIPWPTPPTAYFTGQPLFAFGFGLSYTTFAYEKLALSVASAHPGETVNVAVTVKNSGPRAGDEVVEVYATRLHPPVPMPLRQLVGFQRLPFRAGETKTVEIPVRWSACAAG